MTTTKKKWIVCSGMGGTYRGAFETLEQATKFVAENIVKPRGERLLHWSAQMDPEGAVDYYSWSAPARKMTRADAEALADSGEMGTMTAKRRKELVKHWAACANMDDVPKANEFYEFPNGFVPAVAITSIDREWEYLARSSSAGNDNRDRAATLQGLVA